MIATEETITDAALPPHPVKQTTVTGTVIDRDGVKWVNCGWKAVLVGYVGAPPIYAQDGTRVQTSFNGTVDAQANFSGTLPANDALIPPKTKWRITFYPLASCAPSTFDLAVSGATQGISTIITQNIVPPRFKLIPGQFGYADIEVSPAPSAGTPAIGYANTTTGNMRIWNGTIFVDVTQGALPPNAMQVMPHINTGNCEVTGNTQSADFLATGAASPGKALSARISAQPDACYYDCFGADNATLGSFKMRIATADGSTFAPLIDGNSTGLSLHGNVTTLGNIVNAAIAAYMSNTFTAYGQTATLRMAPQNGDIYISGQGGIMLNFDQGGWVAFGNGAGAQVGSIDAGGNLHVNGNLSCGGSKPFIITHPLHPDRKLVHVCLEGAECGVYYRGEGKTDSRGLCVIELPDYFESLTMQEGRTVLLTVIDTDPDIKNVIPMLASTRVKDGAFRVRSDIEYVSFFWEVKAVRKDVPPLDVEPTTDPTTSHAGDQTP